MVTLILFILILSITVCVHEFGHFIFAKMVGVHAYEFSIGMGPALFKTKPKDKNKTVFAIRAIPLGGFVQLAGEEVEVDPKKHKGHTLQDKKIWQRFLVMFFGPGFNFIFAFLLIFILGIIIGAPSLKPVLSDVNVDYPAYEAGLRAGDTIKKINNHKVTYLDDISLYLALVDKEKSVTFEIVDSNNTSHTYTVIAKKEVKDDKTDYYYSIGMTQTKRTGVLTIFDYAISKTCATFKQMYIVLGNLFTGGLSIKSLSGPVGIYNVVGQVKDSGFVNLIYLLAFLSINVGVINLLPFPAFDGGRILFLVIEKIKGSPVNPKVENIIHTIGFIILILLMLYVTFNDVVNLF